MTEEEQKDFDKWEDDYWEDHPYLQGEPSPEVIVTVIMVVAVVVIGLIRLAVN
ncbi:hypothetical protein KAR91_45440 [Candidatus Pacearchaeota archaeon]|nr:hypothetical protein [Candidatus Pacearchaeota archaeon]